MDQADELLFQLLHVGAQGLDVLDLDLTLLLVDVNKLKLSDVLLSPGLADLEEGNLLLLDHVPGDVAELSVLADLVGRSGAQRHLSEVGASGDRVGELLDLHKVISHHCWVGHGDVLSFPLSCLTMQNLSMLVSLFLCFSNYLLILMEISWD